MNAGSTLRDRLLDEIDNAPSAAEAARRVGYSVRSARWNAYQALQDPTFQAALAARRAERAALARAHAELTIPQVLGRLAALADEAADAGQYGPAVRATELYGRELGMFAQRLDIRMLQVIAQANGVDVDELAARARALERQAARQERKDAQR